jgi:hypothetical protein
VEIPRHYSAPPPLPTIFKEEEEWAPLAFALPAEEEQKCQEATRMEPLLPDSAPIGASIAAVPAEVPVVVELCDQLAALSFDSAKKYARAVWDDEGCSEDGEISLIKGELIEVQDASADTGWWYGRKVDTGTKGLFPSNLVKVFLSLSFSPSSLLFSSLSIHLPFSLIPFFRQHSASHIRDRSSDAQHSRAGHCLRNRARPT